MKAVVFGGAGFLGSHIADALTEHSLDVTVFDRSPSLYLSKGQVMAVGDIMDIKAVRAAVKGADYVYNFAGIAGIEEAMVDPIRTVEINVLGNTHIVQACVESKVKRFIFASSMYVYSDLASFYRCSKQACESIIEEYQKLHGLDFTVLRYGTLYGPRSVESNFIYKMLKQCIDEKKIVRKGDGEELRDFINVLDAARCSVDILTEEFKNQYVIISGTQSTRIKDLICMIKEIFQNKIQVEYIPEPVRHHYTITPYSFKPKVAKKLISPHYHDLGQGILDMIYDINERHNGRVEEIKDLKKMIGS